MSQVIDDDDEDDFSVIAKYEADDIFLSLIHVALNSLSASLLLNIFLSFEVGIAHAIANFKWKENTSSLQN